MCAEDAPLQPLSSGLALPAAARPTADNPLGPMGAPRATPSQASTSAGGPGPVQQSAPRPGGPPPGDYHQQVHHQAALHVHFLSVATLSGDRILLWCAAGCFAHGVGPVGGRRRFLCQRHARSLCTGAAHQPGCAGDTSTDISCVMSHFGSANTGASYVDNQHTLHTTWQCARPEALHHHAVPGGRAPHWRVNQAEPRQGGAAHALRGGTIGSAGPPPPRAGSERCVPQHGGRQLRVSLCPDALYHGCQRRTLALRSR